MRVLERAGALRLERPELEEHLPEPSAVPVVTKAGDQWLGLHPTSLDQREQVGRRERAALPVVLDAHRHYVAGAHARDRRKELLVLLRVEQGGVYRHFLAPVRIAQQPAQQRALFVEVVGRHAGAPLTAGGEVPSVTAPLARESLVRCDGATVPRSLNVTNRHSPTSRRLHGSPPPHPPHHHRSPPHSHRGHFVRTRRPSAERRRRPLMDSSWTIRPNPPSPERRASSLSP